MLPKVKDLFLLIKKVQGETFTRLRDLSLTDLQLKKTLKDVFQANKKMIMKEMRKIKEQPKW